MTGLLVLIQVSATQPVLILAACGLPAKELPSLLTDFFRGNSSPPGAKGSGVRVVLQMEPSKPEYYEEALKRSSFMAAHKIAAAGSMPRVCCTLAKIGNISILV